MHEFINPKSMSTPGLAGGVVMVLTNGLLGVFPEVDARYVALLLSFVVAGVIFWPTGVKRGPRLLILAFWVLNSLVIFVVGFGTAHMAADAAARLEGMVPRAVQALPSLVSPAHAAEAAPQRTKPRPQVHQRGADADGGKSPEALKERLERAQAENARLKSELKSLKRSEAAPSAQSDKGFFKRW